MKHFLTFGALVTELEKYDLLERAAQGYDDLVISEITYNSKEVKEGALFVCKGLSFKPEYLVDAVQRGACCYLSETVYNGVDIPYIAVKNVRRAMSITAIRFFEEEYKKLNIVGITGTKGKTTTTYFVKNILDAYLEKPSAVLSTVEVYTGGETTQAHLTTPESIDLQRHFDDALSHNIRYLTMEVSSQAYLLDRVFGMHFPIGVFLNIGEDHIGPLEHPSYENYLACKLEFIKNCDTAIINGQTKEFDRVMQTAKAHCKQVITYGTSSVEDYWIENIQKQGNGFCFEVCSRDYRKGFRINMLGRFNVENALAAVVVAKILGIPDRCIEMGLEKTQVQGRMNVFEKNGITVIVDYAHNFLSFSRLYESIKLDYPGRRIVTVFGCPGGKAYLRRRDIGKLSGENADYIYLTAEDPQFEEVLDICHDIEGYIKPYGVPYEIIEDRAACVEKAIATAQPGDVIILAAKGEEFYQKVRGEYLYYESDLAIAKRMLGIDGE